MKSFLSDEKLNRDLMLKRLSSLGLSLALLILLCNMTGIFFGLAEVLPSALAFVLLFAAERLQGRKGALSAGLLMMAAALAFCFAAGQLRYGFALYAEKVFSASEAVNRYVYIKLRAEGAGASAAALMAFRAVLSAASGALMYLLSMPNLRFLLPVSALGLVAAFCSFFGLSPEPIYCYGFGLMLLLSLLLGSELRLGTLARAGSVAAYLAICLGLQLFAGGVDAALEARSEDVRDRLSQSFAVMEAEPQELPEEENLTHKESRLNEAEASGTDSSSRPDEFNKNTQYEQEISRPKQTDYFRIFYMTLLSVLLIILPFGIIFLIVRAQRRASAYRADFSSPDSRRAVRALFKHIADIAAAAGLSTGNSNYSELEKELAEGGTIFGEGFSVKFQRALKDWQEASYSVHELDPEEKSFLKSLSDEAERCLYMASDRRKRFRLRFIDCLVSGDSISNSL